VAISHLRRFDPQLGFMVMFFGVSSGWRLWRNALGIRIHKALNAEFDGASEGGVPISERTDLLAWHRGQLRCRTTRSEIGAVRQASAGDSTFGGKIKHRI
jgi:hypothetical protein